MEVTVLCYGHLRDHLPAESDRNGVMLDLPEPADVAAALAALELPETHVFMILVNGHRSELSTELRQGDEVTLMPPFSGG